MIEVLIFIAESCVLKSCNVCVFVRWICIHIVLFDDVINTVPHKRTVLELDLLSMYIIVIKTALLNNSKLPRLIFWLLDDKFYNSHKNSIQILKNNILLKRCTVKFCGVLYLKKLLLCWYRFTVCIEDMWGWL